MKHLHVELISPLGMVYTGEAEAIGAPGVIGSFTLLYNHAPMVAMLGEGKVKITAPNQTLVTYQVSGGVLEINKNKVSILVESAKEI